MPDEDGLDRLCHDLRSPLTVVLGFAELMASDCRLSDEQRREYSERMRAAALEMRDLLDQAAARPAK